MISIKYPSIFTFEKEIDEFRKGWLIPFRGIKLLDSFITLGSDISNSDLTVFSSGSIVSEIGMFRAGTRREMDRGGNGFIYRPIIRFYNRLNYFGDGTYLNRSNNTEITSGANSEDGFVINEKSLLDCVRRSWESLKIFDNDNPLVDYVEEDPTKYVNYNSAVTLASKNIILEFSRWITPDEKISPSPGEVCLPCPLVQTVIEWLRKERKIYVMIDRSPLTLDGWYYYIVENNNFDNSYMQDIIEGRSWEEAARSAVEFCLRNLV